MPGKNSPIKTGHIFIGLAVVMGISTLVLFNTGNSPPPKKEVTEAKIEAVDVIVPLKAIHRGDSITRKDLKRVEWPKAYLPKGDYFSNPLSLIGRTAKQDLFPGEPIFIQKVSGDKSRGGLPTLIPEGKRAITIGVTEIKGVAGFVKPGDRVDVLSTIQLKTEGNQQKIKKTKTLLQNILVLASAQSLVNKNPHQARTPKAVTDGKITPKKAEADEKNQKEETADAEEKELTPKEIEKQEKEAEKKRLKAQKAAKLVSSVTLAVSPEDAEVLTVAEQAGTLRLLLRAEHDYRTAVLPGSDSAQLTGEKKPDPPKVVYQPPPAPAQDLMDTFNMGDEIEFIEGTEKTTVQPGSPL
ncbi:MAG: Flp pilus assembly protein CpaB [Cyanobacteria bacterium P01_H01_bin.74]